MWFVPIIVSAVVLVVFWFILSAIYNNAYVKNDDSVFLISIASKAQTFSHTFDFSPNFMSLKYHLAIKYVVFLACTLITHFADSLTLSSIILSAVTFMHLFTFNARRKEYKNEICTEETGMKKQAYSPIYKGYIVVTVFQIFVYLSNFVVYLLK